jgi:glucuronate isomerase
MSERQVLEALEENVRKLPAIDAHTHLVGGKLGARGLHDILLYHMAMSELYAAGCPNGSRLTQYPGWPTAAEARGRIREALPCLRYVHNTSTSYGIRIILRDLYGWTEEITQDNWQRLDSLIRERADDRAWHREVMRKAPMQSFVTELARREEGQDDDILHYCLEWAFFTRCQWGEFDTALYELERSWGKTPESPTPIGAGLRPPTDRVIRTLDDVHAAVEWYVVHIPVDRIISVATHISTDIKFRLVTESEMAEALKRRSAAGPLERDTYASYINEAFLTALETSHADRIVFQFSLSAEPLPHEIASRLSQRTIAQLAEMISRYPKLRFQCFLSSRYANQSMCTLCRGLPNLSLAGYWWHNFFPSVMRQVMEERLDMLPTNRQIGFFSDAYCVEWAYAKILVVKQQLARVLAERVETGQYSFEMAVRIAEEILHDTPESLLGVAPESAC